MRIRSFWAVGLATGAAWLSAVACGNDPPAAPKPGPVGPEAGMAGESETSSGGSAGRSTGGRGGRGGSGGNAGSGTGGASGGTAGGSSAGTGGAVQNPEDCTEGQIHNGVYCATCPPCDGAGEDGPYEQASLTGLCICKTRPGYFYSTGAEVGTFPCDRDGDGWVRASARGSIQAREDEAIRENARCDLRAIDRFALVNEAGKEKAVKVAPVELYESDRNDDDDLLQFRLETLRLPPYGKDGRVLIAAQLNPLTKLCHVPFGDYNDDGLPDVSEWEGSPRPPTIRSDQAVFIKYSYFAELFNGRYEPPASGETYGRYVIEERSRLPNSNANSRVPITYGPTEGTYWQRCPLLPDSKAGSLMPPVGMDFASLGNVNFHSQFKCLSVVSTHDANNANALLPSELGNKYRLNKCSGQGPPTPGDKNPDRAVFACELVDRDDVAAGDVLWGAVRYIDYQDPDDYVRGCINECSIDKECEDIAPGVDGCIRDTDDFGRKTGCAEECDGLDNDGDGAIDNGTNDLDCETEYPGVCATGKTRCRNGVLSCTSTMPGDLPERCDDIDQDCDGDPVTGTLSPIPEVGQVCTTAERFDTQEGVYKPLFGNCRFGTRQCVEDRVTMQLRLSCVSDVEGTIPDEDPCDNTDNDCDGDVDETRTEFEGDDPGIMRRQCSDGIDNNCDGVTDGLPRGGAFDEKLLNHTAEICANGIDDDCDGRIDEKYEQTADVMTGPGCAWACDAADQGALACSHQGIQVPAHRYDPAGLDNPAKIWFFDPPWFNDFWKVIKCQDRYWQVAEVCGLDATALPRVSSAWGGNYTTTACREPSPGAAVCTSDTSGLTFIGCQHTQPTPNDTAVTTPTNCLECYPNVASGVGCAILAAP